MPSPLAHTMIGLGLGAGFCLPRGGGWRRLGGRIWRWRGLLLVCVILCHPAITRMAGQDILGGLARK